MKKIVILTGPSASGKTTILESLIQRYPNIDRIKTNTTRKKRFEEESDYNFLNIEDFKTGIESDEFLEYEEVYPGTFYGTRKSDISSFLNLDNDNYVFMCLDVRGAIKMKKILGNNCSTIFLNPGKWEVIKERLDNRDNKDDLEFRLIKYKFEMSFESFFDVSISTEVMLDVSVQEVYDYTIKTNSLKPKTLIVNLYGGPGTGKSTMAAALFSELKFLGINCELVTEYAKDKVWENSIDVLNNSIHIFGEQHHRIWRLLGNVDVIVTDSPLLLSYVYTDKNSLLRDLILDEHLKLNNLEIFLERGKEFNPIGRVQNFEESKEKDQEILRLLNEKLIPYVKHKSDRSSIGILLDIIKEKL